MFNPFRKLNASTRLSSDQAKREGRIIRFAIASFDGSSAAMSFLNTPHDELGGRPMDIATASDDGLAAVERLLSRRNTIDQSKS